MFIDPIQAINTIGQMNQINPIKESERAGGTTPNESATGEDGIQVPFQSFFQDALEDVIRTDEQVNIDAEMLATGKSDNLHQYSIDIAKAQISVDLMVELRNKAMDAYSEVMRMSV